MKILLVEDDEVLTRMLTSTLGGSGFEFTVVDNVESVIDDGLDKNHDLIVLDLMLSGKRRGEHLVEELRARKSEIPIIVLTGVDDVSMKVDLLNLGVDDYVTKPFNTAELLARVQAVYRRYLEKYPSESEVYGDISFYWRQNKIVREGTEISLTQKEALLLKFLLHHRGKTIRNEDILTKIWKARAGFHSNVIQSTVRRLRNKIDKGFEHKLIRNVHGVGYTLVLPEEENI